jgi:anthranilate phosphoribosyltransferase
MTAAAVTVDGHTAFGRPLVPDAPSAGACPDFSTFLQRLAERRDLSREEASAALRQIADSTVGEAQAAAFLMGLRAKGETAEEIAGLADAMRHLAVRVVTSSPDALVDIVGTGGDGLDTFNISTTAAFVVAGAGVRVAKHGNRAASSRSGAADVLQALGARVDLGPAEVAASIEETGMGFMLASLYHSSMSQVGAVRRSLGIRTVFNFLGPVTNPAGARRILLGVSVDSYLGVLAEALACTGCSHALLVHGCDGMDELSVTGPNLAVEVIDGHVASPKVIHPEDCGLSVHPPASLAGGDPAENALITRKILGGMRGGPRDAVLFNAGAALYVSGKVSSIVAGVDAARASIDSGSAARTLDRFIAFSNAVGRRP